MVTVVSCSFSERETTGLVLFRGVFAGTVTPGGLSKPLSPGSVSLVLTALKFSPSVVLFLTHIQLLLQTTRRRKEPIRCDTC